MVQWITLPGISDYQQTIELMEDTVASVISGTVDETIYLLEHNEVYTAGSSFKVNELLNSNEIPVVYTGRGGKFTYHGKGQRIIYPVLNLSIARRSKDLKLYIHMLENWIINVLRQIDIEAFTIHNKVGIWVRHLGQEAKIAAIGIRVRKWVTYHGIAVNISTDLKKFSGIIPCGIEGGQTVSLSALGASVTLQQFDCILQQEFNKIGF
ncbi:lipoyl(octanoyl) transferase LipB [Candidatus Trichorickettsia mobilis]|nr:lipoyl(octanoyl) transferase LipB [Candidatus Trichorickettsia mobilis]